MTLTRTEQDRLVQILRDAKVMYLEPSRMVVSEKRSQHNRLLSASADELIDRVMRAELQ